MHAIFEKIDQGLKIILFFMVLIVTLSITARLLVRYKLRDSDTSNHVKKAFEDLAAVIVAGILGIIMLQVLGRMK